MLVTSTQRRNPASCRGRRAPRTGQARSRRHPQPLSGGGTLTRGPHNDNTLQADLCLLQLVDRQGAAWHLWHLLRKGSVCPWTCSSREPRGLLGSWILSGAQQATGSQSATWAKRTGAAAANFSEAAHWPTWLPTPADPRCPH